MIVIFVVVYPSCKALCLYRHFSRYCFLLILLFLLPVTFSLLNRARMESHKTQLQLELPGSYTKNRKWKAMCFFFLSSLSDFDFHFSFNMCFINFLHMTHDIYIIITQMVVKAPNSIYSIHSFQASRNVFLVHLMSKVYPYSNYLCLRLAITLNKDKMIGLFFPQNTPCIYLCM